MLALFVEGAESNIPGGILLDWLTTNRWARGQQAHVIKRMPPITPGGSALPTKTTTATMIADPKTQTQTPPARPAQKRPANGRVAGSRKNKNRKGGRR